MNLLNYTSDYDILFLDIEMPESNGIYIGEEIIKKHPNLLIFIVTSHPEYLDDAMRIHVFRYLSKPIDKHRLFRNLKDALRQYHMYSNKIIIETKNDVTQTSLNDIVMVERSGKDVLIHTTQASYKSIHALSYWLDQLKHPAFYQSHRSYIVNFKYIEHFDHSTIQLFNKSYTAYLTNRKFSQFRKAYINYIESTR